MIDVSNQNPLIRRAFMALEDGEWVAAYKYCEEVLNQEPENAYAYLGELLAKLYCHNPRELLERETPLAGDPLFEKILCFGTQDLRDKLNWIDQGIVARIEEKRRVQAQEEEEQRIQEEEAAEERRKRVRLWLKRLAQIFVVWIFVTQFLIPFFHYTSIERAKVGDYVKFGKYQGDTLTWRVLDVQENKKLLITEFGIDPADYDKKYGGVTWEFCTSRKWLNNVFYFKFFNEKEKSVIVWTSLENKYNPQNGPGGGGNTWDKVFYLSIEEVEKYFKDKDDRCCLPTEWALRPTPIENKPWLKIPAVDTMESYYKKYNLELAGDQKKYKEYCAWWLRDGGWNRSSYKLVSGFGEIADLESIIPIGREWHSCVVAFRPALWVKVEP